MRLRSSLHTKIPDAIAVIRTDALCDHGLSSSIPKLKGKRARTSGPKTLPLIGPFPSALWRLIIDKLDCPEAALALGAVSRKLHEPCSNYPVHLKMELDKDTRANDLPCTKRLSRRIKLMDLNLTFKRGTPTLTCLEALSSLFSRAPPKLELKGDEECLNALAVGLEVYCPSSLTTLTVLQDGGSSLRHFALSLSRLSGLVALDIAVKGNDEWSEIARLTRLTDLTIRYQSYQNPNPKPLTTLQRLKTFNFIQEDLRARIQLDCFDFLTGVNDLSPDCLSVHLDVVLARQESDMSFLANCLCLSKLELIIMVPDDAIATVGGLFKSLQRVQTHGALLRLMEDDMFDRDEIDGLDGELVDEGENKILDISLVIRANGLSNNRSTATELSWDSSSSNRRRYSFSGCNMHWVDPKAEKVTSVLHEKDICIDNMISLSLHGNTVPLRGLPESLVATSISRLTLVYCMLDIKDLSILVSMGTQLKSLSIVSDLSNVSKEAPEALWEALVKMTGLQRLEISHWQCDVNPRHHAHSSSVVAPQAQICINRLNNGGYKPSESVFISAQHVFLCISNLTNLQSLTLTGFTAGSGLIQAALQLKGFMSRVSRGKAAAALSNSISVPAKGNLRSEHLNNYVFFIGTTSGYIRHGTPGVCPTPHTWGPTVHLGSKLFPASLGSSGQQYPGHPFQVPEVSLPEDLSSLDQGGILDLHYFSNLKDGDPIFAYKEDSQPPSQLLLSPVATDNMQLNYNKLTSTTVVGKGSRKRTAGINSGVSDLVGERRRSLRQKSLKLSVKRTVEE